MKLVPIFSLITVCYSRPNTQESGNIIYNLLEKGWEAGRQEIAAAIDRNENIEDTIKDLSNIKLQDAEKPAHELMQSGIDTLSKLGKEAQKGIQQGIQYAERYLASSQFDEDLKNIESGFNNFTEVDSKRLLKRLMKHYTVHDKIENSVSNVDSDLGKQVANGIRSKQGLRKLVKQLKYQDPTELMINLTDEQARQMIIELSKVDNFSKKILRKLIPSLVLKLLRNSYEYINVDGEGAVVLADVETRILGMYLEYFCEAEGVFNDEQLMQSLRGNVGSKKLSADDVLLWAQFELDDDKTCSSSYLKLASHNWHLIEDAASSSIQEIDINWDDEFNYDEFKLFQYAMELKLATNGGGNKVGGLVNSNYCSEPYCYPTDFEDSFCAAFNERNRNFSSTSSDALRVIMVVDQSGSMSSLTSQTIRSFNWFLSKQRKAVLKGEQNPPQFTLSKFNTQQKVDSWNNIKQAHKLNRWSYRPGGGTRLHDSLECIYKQFGHEKNNILMIITDGMDNASQLDDDDVKATLEKLINENGWVANYIGANQNAKSVGMNLGVPEENCVTYNFSNEGLDNMYRGLNKKLSDQRINQFMNQIAGN